MTALAFQTPSPELSLVPVLELHDVSFRYHARGPLVVSQLSFRDAAGEIVALVGPNGSGKTSTIRLAAGYLLPHSGTIRRGGVDATAAAARRATVYLADDPLVPPRLTAREYFAFCAAARKLDENDFVESAVREAQAFGLEPEALDRVTTELSRGQLRKVALAAAFAGSPALLLVDEPTEALDEAGIAALANRVRQFAADGGAVLMATHDFDFIRATGAQQIASGHNS